MKIGQTLFRDGKYWTVTMLTSAYATIELIDKPSVWKMIRV